MSYWAPLMERACYTRKRSTDRFFPAADLLPADRFLWHS